ncbi:MAG: glycosyltransferase, partial [Flavobacterium sp.]
QMPVVYQACDIFCLPSQGPGETWGLAINEAMAAGKAIVASDKVGCAVDLVKDGINGYVFKSNDLESLKEKLALMIQQPQSIDDFGKISQKIIQDWSFEFQVAQFIKTLNATN